MMQAIFPALYISLKVAFFAVLLNVFFGIGAGYLLARKSFKGKELLDTLLTLPMVLPPTILGYYLIVLLGRHGWLGQYLDRYFGINLIFTWQGAVVAAMIVSFPLVFKPARAAFEAVDIKYENAARVLGVGELAIFFRITLPLAWRGILAGLLLAFARCLGEFGATLMIAGSIPGKTQTLSIAVYQAVQAGDDQQANYLVLMTSFVCIVVLLLARFFKPAKGGQDGF